MTASIGAVFQGGSCVLCGDQLGNALELDTGVCDACTEVDVYE